jgi:hypothetical protein
MHFVSIRIKIDLAFHLLIQKSTMSRNDKLICVSDKAYADVSENPFLYDCMGCDKEIRWDALFDHTKSDAHVVVAKELKREIKIFCRQCNISVKWEGLSRHLSTTSHFDISSQLVLMHQNENRPDVAHGASIDDADGEGIVYFVDMHDAQVTFFRMMMASWTK